MQSFAAGIFSNIIYHYDRSLLLLLAPQLASTFFPQTDPVYALICTYLLLPLGTISKPLGALIFGYLADTIGIKKSLSMMLIGSSLSTIIIPCLPTYSDTGWLACLCLALAQLSRNFFSSTQSTSTAIFILEQTDTEKKCLMSSWFDASGILGTFFGTAATCLVHLYGTSWHYLFLVSGCVGLIELFLFLSLTLASAKPTQPKENFSWKILCHHKYIVFSIAAVSGFSYMNYYVAMAFMSSFLPLISSISPTQALSMQTFLLVFDFFLLPIMGYVGTKIGKTTLMIYGISGVVISSLPLFMMLQNSTIISACLIRMIFVFFGICLAAPYHAWALEISPREYRYVVNSVGAAIGSRLLGAPIPALCFFLYHKTGLLVAPALPLIFMGLLAVMVLVSHIARQKLPNIKSEKLSHFFYKLQESIKSVMSYS